MHHRFNRSLLSLATLALLPAFAAAQTTIPAATGNFNANTAGTTYTLNAGDTRQVTSGSTEAITVGSSSGTITLNINGTASQSGSGRGIRSSTGAGSITVSIGANGLVKAVSDDAIQGRNTGAFNLTNLGTLYSGPNISGTPLATTSTGRGLNLRDAGGGTVVNGSTTNSTALIQADGNDAVRVGVGFSFTNYGSILANGVINDSAANNALSGGSTAKTYTAGAGFSFEDPSGSVGSANSSLDNYGSISGARHGVQSGVLGTNLTVTNEVGGTIIGRNGSGVGFDATNASPANATVNNSGLIRGDYAGAGHVIDQTGSASATNDGDGDGVDIDGAATIHNYSTGQILATGAGGYDSEGRKNTSDGVSIGGGVITNDGLIRGADVGIVVNNDTNASRSGVAATSITNNAGATIEGQNSYAIRLENKLGDARDNDTINNAGTITGGGTIPAAGTVTLQGGAVDTNSTGTLDGVAYTGTGDARFIRGDGSAIQMGEGDDVLTNTGTIDGSATGRAVNMEGGNDTVNYNAGTITGEINGGAGSNILNLGAGVSTASKVLNFGQINVASGTGTLSGVVSGTALTKGGAGTLTLTAANDYTGLTTISAGTLRVNNTAGSGTGSGNVQLNSAATLAGAGFISGSVVADGAIAPGNSIGTLTVNGDVTWNGTAENAWQFELGNSNAADQLLLGGDFLKGTGTDFVFDFKSGGTLGTFELVDWTGATSFLASDFSYINLDAAFAGSFAINGHQLEFTTTAVPEPATWAALAGAAALGLAVWRRRAAR